MKRAGMTSWALTVVMICVLVFGLAGCGTSSSDRIELVKNYVQQAQNIATQIDEKLLVVTKSIDDFEAQLAALPADDPLVATVQTGIDQAQKVEAELNQKKQLALKTLAELNTTLAGIESEGADWVDEIALLAAGGGSVGAGVGGETGGKIAIGATLLGLLAGLLRQWKKKTVVEAHFATVVRSVDAALNGLTTESQEQAKETLKTVQGSAVTAAVKAVKAT